jgi:hypothetical protein
MQKGMGLQNRTSGSIIISGRQQIAFQKRVASFREKLRDA